MTCGCNCNKTPHTCHSNLHSRCSKPQPVIYSMEMDTNARRYTSHLSLCTSTHQPLYVTHYTKNIQQKCLLPEGGGGGASVTPQESQVRSHQVTHVMCFMSKSSTSTVQHSAGLSTLLTNLTLD